MKLQFRSLEEHSREMQEMMTSFPAKLFYGSIVIIIIQLLLIFIIKYFILH